MMRMERGMNDEWRMSPLTPNKTANTLVNMVQPESDTNIVMGAC